MEGRRNKKVDLQNLFLCGNGRNKKLKEQVRTGEKTSGDRNKAEEKRHKEVFARKLNLEIGRWNTLPLTCPSAPVRLASLPLRPSAVAISTILFHFPATLCFYINVFPFFSKIWERGGGRVSIRSTEVVAHVIAYRAVARRKLIKSTWNKWCRSGIIFLSSLIVSLLAFSPKTQSGYKKNTGFLNH